MKYFNETDKAVKLKIWVDYYNWERERSYYVWLPKSQLNENGVPSEWISKVKAQDVQELHLGGCVFICWEDANGDTFKAEKSAKEQADADAREARFEAGCKAYEELVKQAKAMGIKGVRIGMRKATIEAKIAQAQA